MLVGFLILFAMCITLIKEADLYFQISGTTMKLDTFWIPKDVSVKQWTIVVVSSFSLLFFITSAIVFNHLTGYYSIKVTGKSEVKQETINMEYMN